jgi:hypothetical protein
MWLTLPLDIIWKHDMGERHWTFASLVGHTFLLHFAVFFLMLLAFPSELVVPAGHEQVVYHSIAILYFFLLLMWVFGLANLWEIRQQKKAGVQGHTHYWGTPRFLPDKPIVHWLIIPLASTLLAGVTWWLFPPLGIYLFFLAVLQIVDTTDVYRQKWIEKLDRRDREIQMAIKIAEIEHSHRPELEIVRIARPPHRPRSAPDAANFETRWQQVLTRSAATRPALKTPSNRVT